jgi:hypothetical protein
MAGRAKVEVEKRCEIAKQRGQEPLSTEAVNGIFTVRSRY